MQHIVEDERSDREETDDSEDEVQESDRQPKMKNGPLQNGHSASNNHHHHRKME